MPTSTPATGSCAYCSHQAPRDTLEPINLAGNLACRDGRMCRARQAGQHIARQALTEVEQVLSGNTDLPREHVIAAAMRHLAEQLPAGDPYRAVIAEHTLAPPAPAPGRSPEDKLTDRRPVVTLHAAECRECSDFATEATEDQEAVAEAQSRHFDQTGHSRYWMYSLQRGTAQMESMATLRARLRGSQV